MKPTLIAVSLQSSPGRCFLLAAVVGSGIMGERLAAGTSPSLFSPTPSPQAPLWSQSSSPSVHLRGASQSSRDPCRCMAGWYRMARDPGIYRSTDGRSICRGCIGSSHVRARSIYRVDACPHRPRSTLQRVHRYLRSALCHLGMRQAPALRRSLRRGRIHHRRVLVYRVYFLRQPSRHTCSIREQHVRRNQTRRCGGFVAAQLAGAFAATLLFRWLIPSRTAASAVMLDRDQY